jgi:hypothetical protein
LGPGCGQTKHHVVLGQHHPKLAAQRHPVLGLLPLGCSPSATLSRLGFMISNIKCVFGINLAFMILVFFLK